MSKSQTTTDLDRMRPIHPGEFLREEFLPDYGLTAYALAKRLNVSRSSIEELIREKRGVSADLAIRLAKAFGTPLHYWFDLQSDYEARVALEKGADQYEMIEPVPGG